MKSLTLFILSLCFTQAAYAIIKDPGICRESVPENYPNKNPPEHYGNAKIDSFRCALSGTTELTPEQIKQRKRLIPEKHDYRFYGRVGINAGAHQLRLPGIVISKASNQFDVALGYRWTYTSLELEWLNLNSIIANNLQVKNPINDNLPAINLNVTVKGHAILLGLNYEFYKFYNYSPYLNASIGVTNNNIAYNINDSINKSIDVYSLSGGLGMGVKFNIYSRFYADVLIRGLFLGQTRYESKKAQRLWLGASLRLVWLF